MNTVQFRSVAQWPKGTCSWSNDITEDEHFTREDAEGVCDLLREKGYGLDGKILPIKCWVERI
jgi:hypothetical protein